LKIGIDVRAVSSFRISLGKAPTIKLKKSKQSLGTAKKKKKRKIMIE
jgi:hypothetical protein